MLCGAMAGDTIYHSKIDIGKRSILKEFEY